MRALLIALLLAGAPAPALAGGPSCASFASLLPPIVRDRRDKIGFYTPMARWLREHAPWIASVMTREFVEEVGVVDPDWFAAQLRALLGGVDAAQTPVWRSFIFHLWAQRFELDGLGVPRDVGRGTGRHRARSGRSADGPTDRRDAVLGATGAG